MTELLTQFWWVLAAAVLIGLIVAWLLFANRRTRVETRQSGDVLDEGAAAARRNQALIDTPPAAAVPVAAAAPPAAASLSPAPAAAPAPSAGSADDLSRIKGVGPKLVALLDSLGVTSFAQIAGWSEADIQKVDAQLGNFSGRIERDNWIEQARFLAKGDTAEFENRFGKV